jgi:hypothetical protein
VRLGDTPELISPYAALFKIRDERLSVPRLEGIAAGLGLGAVVLAGARLRSVPRVVAEGTCQAGTVLVRSAGSVRPER